MNDIAVKARDALLHRLAAIKKRHARTEEELHKVEAGAELDWHERASSTDDSEILGRLSKDERLELEEIDAALDRIRKQTFGQCETCGRRIGRQRLRALPETRYCIECAEDADRAIRKQEA